MTKSHNQLDFVLDCTIRMISLIQDMLLPMVKTSGKPCALGWENQQVYGGDRGRR